MEKENGSLFIKMLEEPMETNIKLKTPNDTIDVKLKGTVDRIDVINNTYRKSTIKQVGRKRRN